MGRRLILDAYASAPHYAAHIEPVWAALPPEARGTFWTARARDRWGTPVPARWPLDRLVLVASYVDARRARPRPVVYLEHGAGQTYPGDSRSAGHPSYSGGRELDHVVLFLCPSGVVADRWSARYPDVPAVVVGCPYLDRWHRIA